MWKHNGRFEPRHDKNNKMAVRPAKTQISLGICPVWSESSLGAQWVAKDPSFLPADSKDSNQSGRMPRLIRVFAGRSLILLVLSCRGSFLHCFQVSLFSPILWFCNYFFFCFPLSSIVITSLVGVGCSADCLCVCPYLSPCLMPYANKKGADQPAHPQVLVFANPQRQVFIWERIIWASSRENLSSGFATR